METTLGRLGDRKRSEKVIWKPLSDDRAIVNAQKSSYIETTLRGSGRWRANRKDYMETTFR